MFHKFKKLFIILIVLVFIEQGIASTIPINAESTEKNIETSLSLDQITLEDQTMLTIKNHLDTPVQYTLPNGLSLENNSQQIEVKAHETKSFILKATAAGTYILTISNSLPLKLSVTEPKNPGASVNNSSLRAMGFYGASLGVYSKFYTTPTREPITFYPYTEDDYLTYQASMYTGGNFKTWGQMFRLDDKDKICLTEIPTVSTSGGLTPDDVTLYYSTDGTNFSDTPPSDLSVVKWVKYIVTQPEALDTSTQSITVNFQAKSLPSDQLTDSDFGKNNGHQPSGVFFATGRDDNRYDENDMSGISSVIFANPTFHGYFYQELTTEHGRNRQAIDPTFPPVAGITAQMLDENNNVIAQTVSDENGLYTFSKIPRTDVAKIVYTDPKNEYYTSYCYRASDPGTSDPGDYAWYSFEGNTMTFSDIRSIYSSLYSNPLRKVEQTLSAKTQDIYYVIGDPIPNIRTGVTALYDSYEGDIRQFRLYNTSNNYTFRYDDSQVKWDTPGKYPVKLMLSNMNYAFGYAYTPEMQATSRIDTTIYVYVSQTKPPVIQAADREVYTDENFDPLENVTATDPDDGSDLTDQIVVTDNQVDMTTPGVYPVTYRVTDKDGDSTEKTVHITVRDLSIQAADQTIMQGDTFDPLKNVTAADSAEGDLTDKVSQTNNVNSAIPGIYQATYSVQNSAGHRTEKTVRVTVLEREKPVIQADDQTIYCGDSFDPMNHVTATDGMTHEDLTDKVIVTRNDVLPDTPGVYAVTYQVENSLGGVTEKTIHVTVRDLTISASDQTLQVGDTFDPMKGVTAMDTVQGDITASVKVIANDVDTEKVGLYHVTYQATNNDGHQTTKAIAVRVMADGSKNTPPVIDAADLTLALNSTYNPYAHATAYDKEDGDLTSKLQVVSNNVDTSKAGSYETTYAVTDSAGATTSKSIRVTVLAEGITPNPNSSQGPTGSPFAKQALLLPKTGDTQAGWYVLSGLIILGAGILLVRKKRKHS
ncbi:immunoglobulin-like domain-containing protein [Listeria costaricensis]|uniref:immunoglobulin-like domain-containing protein n=1 Tax=Listeria costaricensis TaxID=2026604 RepID=UPI000C0748A4|nr:immunoglobulin-like domain-containing protein [Listeria costaricensis]